MLVLKRRPGQSIMIGEHIEVTILSISAADDNVRVGITAPRELQVDRREVHERKLLEAKKRGE